jgi:hypothetical protein
MTSFGFERGKCDWLARQFSSSIYMELSSNTKEMVRA